MPTLAPLILVIDDEDDFRAILGHILARAGYRVEIASGGASGLGKLRELRPSLVICDLSMPDMTGLEVVRQAREEGDRTPVLMVTVRSQMSSVGEAMASGVDDYILKPFEPEDLLARVAQALRKCGK